MLPLDDVEVPVPNPACALSQRHSEASEESHLSNSIPKEVAKILFDNKFQAFSLIATFYFIDYEMVRFLGRCARSK
jgi:hypothetical protein